MNIRNRGLPPGWYPATGLEVERTVVSYTSGMARGSSLACMAPHAGWTFSGAIAARALFALAKDVETVVVFGGHLPARSSVLFAEEDSFETPMGAIFADRELRDAFLKEVPCGVDHYVDNTVEVHLPMIHFLFPHARILWIRLPASYQSFEIGESIASIATKLSRRVVAIGSTDLTHYGPNYGFEPHGLGEDAEKWVRTQNDAAFLDAVLSGDPGKILERAAVDFSACSPGAALGALGFAKDSGASNAELLAYGTSADIASGSSFVGYGAIAWS